MIALPILHPKIDVDIQKLANYFVHGYRFEDHLFYLSTTNDKGLAKYVDVDILSSWDTHWIAHNQTFELKLLNDHVLKTFSRKMFFVWDGNYRLLASRQFIEIFHCNDLEWQFEVDCIFVNTFKQLATLMTFMYDVKKRVCHFKFLQEFHFTYIENMYCVRFHCFIHSLFTYFLLSLH